jgi:hypothetical protein
MSPGFTLGNLFYHPALKGQQIPRRRVTRYFCRPSGRLPKKNLTHPGYAFLALQTAEVRVVIALAQLIRFHPTITYS